MAKLASPIDFQTIPNEFSNHFKVNGKTCVSKFQINFQMVRHSSIRVFFEYGETFFDRFGLDFEHFLIQKNTEKSKIGPSGPILKKSDQISVEMKNTVRNSLDF